jgi:RimJ/RimL family protein N-acetyltransferase
VEQYIRNALDMPGRLSFAVLDASTDAVIGSTSYHDIMPSIGRVEIGWTWYAKSRQRSHVNTSCKLLLLSHAFDTLGCAVVGFRTDNFNFASQAAIERLGARRDGVIRHNAPRRDGTVRDTVMYSILRGEWPEIKSHLHYQLSRHEK